MDTLTHALSGALLAQMVAAHLPPANRPTLRRTFTVGALTAAFPDSDVVISFFSDQLTYLNLHRGVTHSLILLPLWALLLASIFTLLDRERRNWRGYFLLAMAGIAIHIAGDVITTYGTQIFAPFSPCFWYKSVKMFREDAKWQDKYLIRGTWGADIVDALKPQKGDIYVEKPRFSAFFGTNLDGILKTLNIKYLVFTGCATNICVEASIRDAGHLGYFPVMLTDATINNGPPFMQESTIFNVKLCYGWVTEIENLFQVMK